MHNAGIVLAAGASERMGRPKALLELPDGMPLARAQADALSAAGCEPVTVVVGAEGDATAPQLAPCRVTVNTEWRRGRMSSVQAGIRALPEAQGYLLLPVDAVGVTVRTLKDVLQFAGSTGVQALRPTYHEQDGYVLWISGATARELLSIESTPDIRLRDVLDLITLRVEMEDAAVLRNINTPDDWAAVRAGMGYP